jgi:hypothetical protein
MIYFLSSIPRSGSTLLASLLEQREDTYVSPTSSLGALVKSFLALPNIPDVIFGMMNTRFNGKYADKKERYIFDKGRMWTDPKIMELVKRFQGQVKIIATVRPMVECISSFYLVEKTTMSIEKWMKESDTFMGLMQAYHDFKNGYELHPERFCLIQYDDLCENTQRELNRISDFIGSPVIKYIPEIEQVEDNDRDNMWGIDGLHTLRPIIERDKTDPRTVLGLDIYNTYTEWDFWSDNPKYKPWECGETTMQFIEA